MIGTRDAGISLLTWACFVPLAVATAVFGPVLILFAGHTREYWAWPISPNMSAVWVGCGYTFGAIAITTMLVRGRAGTAIVPILSTIPFAIVMLAATIIHNDRFFTDKPGYYVWLVIYAILPFALPVMLWQNLQRSAGEQEQEPRLPGSIRLVLICAGVAVGILGLFLVLAPSVLANTWPWHLTPLMSQIVGGWLLFLAAGGLSPLFEKRCEAYRCFLPPAALWFSILFVASLVNHSDFDFGRLATLLYFSGVGVAVLGLSAIWLYMESISKPT